MSNKHKRNASESTSISEGTERPLISRDPLVPPFALSLEVVDGPDAGTRYQLKRSRTLIGRSGCDINFPEDRLVSRKHASIEVYNSQYVMVRDLASTNGTSLNGFLIVQVKVSPGDVIGIGGVKLRLVEENPE
ncbi:MAG: FHA domain-containing protein [Acidobacteria bacterium]|jgi:S-DNA-T family DNA segregation ATPase FtsK/SpoIIIE|nr:FHA domain-containing protein [Acidobacteriota bacterium]